MVRHIFCRKYDQDNTPSHTPKMISNINEDINKGPIGIPLSQGILGLCICDKTLSQSLACGRFLDWNCDPLTAPFVLHDDNTTITDDTQEYALNGAAFADGAVITAVTRYEPSQNLWTTWYKIYGNDNLVEVPKTPISSDTTHNTSLGKVAVLSNQVIMFSFLKDDGLWIKGIYRNTSIALDETRLSNATSEQNYLAIQSFDSRRFSIAQSQSVAGAPVVDFYQFTGYDNLNPTPTPVSSPTKKGWNDFSKQEKDWTIAGIVVGGLLILCGFFCLIKHCLHRRKMKKMVSNIEAANYGDNAAS